MYLGAPESSLPRSKSTAYSRITGDEDSSALTHPLRPPHTFKLGAIRLSPQTHCVKVPGHEPWQLIPLLISVPTQVPDIRDGQYNQDKQVT
jgi:hypothetical protein